MESSQNISALDTAVGALEESTFSSVFPNPTSQGTIVEVKPVRELRAIRKNGGDSTVVGFYDDPQLFRQYAQQLNDLGYSIYSPINPIQPGTAATLGYVLNAEPRGGPSTGDIHISRRVALPCDFDCERPVGTPATEEMRTKARGAAEKLAAWFLDEHGIKPTIVDSGNGFHVIVRIDLPNDAESTELVKRALAALSARFSVSGVKLDTVLYNASRILRVPGFRNTKDSAGRMCTRIQTGLGTLERAALEEIADSAGKTGALVITASHGVIMPEGWDPEVELERAGLIFKRRQEGEQVSLEYYELMGKCLLNDGPHDGNNNNRKSRFLWSPATRTISHQCFDSDCQALSLKTPTALLNLGIDVDQQSLEDKLAGMNEKYCYVDHGDFVVKLSGMRMYDSQRFTNGGHLANQFHITSAGFKPDGTPKVRKERIAKLWIEWPLRKQVEKIVYEPGRDRFYEDCINRWQGMGVEPLPGDVRAWQWLLEHIIPDPQARRWFEQWCAYPLQNLGAKLKSAVILWGRQQGTGKTTLASTLSRIYGTNAAAITEAQLHAQFNDWALDKQFICADEITGGDKRGTADFLKELIAGHEHISINQKFQPTISVRNCINFLFTSNHPNSFYLEPTDRRYFVIEVPSVLPDRQYFDRYYAWLDSDGPAFLYHHLLNLSLDEFHPHAEPPLTEAKSAMIEVGKSDLDHWLEEQRDADPEMVRTTEEFLASFSGMHAGSGVKRTGMRAALQRLGAAYRQVRIAGKKVDLWCLNPAWKDQPSSVWTEKYARKDERRAS